jgi:hypothetical protein
MRALADYILKRLFRFRHEQSRERARERAYRRTRFCLVLWFVSAIGGFLKANTSTKLAILIWHQTALLLSNVCVSVSAMR